MTSGTKLLEQFRTLETLRLKEELQQEYILKSKAQKEKTLLKGQLALNTEVIVRLNNKDISLRARESLTDEQYLILKSNINSQSRPIVAWFQGSAKNPYEIKAHEKYGLSCNCRSWIFNQRGNRTCKHTIKADSHIRVV